MRETVELPGSEDLLILAQSSHTHAESTETWSLVSALPITSTSTGVRNERNARRLFDLSMWGSGFGSIGRISPGQLRSVIGSGRTACQNQATAKTISFLQNTGTQNVCPLIIGLSCEYTEYIKLEYKIQNKATEFTWHSISWVIRPATNMNAESLCVQTQHQH